MTSTTKPTKRERPLLRLLSFVVSNAHRICTCLIVASILGLLALPLLDRPIRFDEKGLLAGLAHANVGYSNNAASPEVQRIASAAGGTNGFQRPGAAAMLVVELRRAGLTDTQLTRPSVIATAAAGAPTLCRCTNVHTRVRAPRGDGMESMALVTPIAFSAQRPEPAHDGRNQSASAAQLALMAASSLMLHMAQGHVASGGGAGNNDRGGGRWLVRDLLWVIPDLSCGSYQCLEAWVRQYYEDTGALAAMGRRGGGGVRRGRNQGKGQGQRNRSAVAAASAAPMIRAGVIQQAVVLEAMAGATYDTSELLVVGHDGLLPKLDMYYLLRYLFNYPASLTLWREERVEGPAEALTARLVALLPEGLVPRQALHGYVRRLLTGLQFGWQQAVGRPSAAHAAFKDFMVDAATVRLVRRRPPAPSSRAALHDLPGAPHLHHRALALAASLELALRSLNNLVERVHHSPFLYLLTGLDAYVSVERYVVPAVALAAALQLQAAWSMGAAQRALGPPAAASAAAAAGAAVAAAAAAAPPPPGSAPRVWAVAAARAAARMVFLAVAAAGLRLLACEPSPWSPWRAPPGGEGEAAAAGFGAAGVAAAAAAAAVRRLFFKQLSATDGLLTAAAVLVAAGAAAVAAAGGAGRMAGAAALGVRRRKGGTLQHEPQARKRIGVADEAAAVKAEKALVRDTDSAGEGEGREGGAAAQVLLAAAWHAERVLVLTATAAAMTALVCLNWAAAVLAGMYLAPLALLQGWAAGRMVESRTCNLRPDALQAGVPPVWWKLVWWAWNPLSFAFTICTAASAVGIAEQVSVFTGTGAQALCCVSTTNYWYISVVVSSFWLFGVDGDLLGC